MVLAGPHEYWKIILRHTHIGAQRAKFYRIRSLSFALFGSSEIVQFDKCVEVKVAVEKWGNSFDANGTHNGCVCVCGYLAHESGIMYPPYSIRVKRNAKHKAQTSEVFIRSFMQHERHVMDMKRIRNALEWINSHRSFVCIRLGACAVPAFSVGTADRIQLGDIQSGAPHDHIHTHTHGTPEHNLNIFVPTQTNPIRVLMFWFSNNMVISARQMLAGACSLSVNAQSCCCCCCP